MNKKLFYYIELRKEATLLDEYYRKLGEQYTDATGKKIQGNLSEQFPDEFSGWLADRKESMLEFKSVMTQLGLGYDFPLTAELNKGKYDSVVSSYTLPSVISPYAYTIDFSNNLSHPDFVLKGQLKFEDKKPSKKDIEFDSIKFTYGVYNLLIHNPLLETDIMPLTNVFDLYRCQFIVGVYGKTSDKDRDVKIKKLLELKKQLQDNCIDCSYEKSGNYGYVISSNYDYSMKKTLSK